MVDYTSLCPGVAVDLSHIDSVATVKGFAGAEELGASLKGADVVVIPAGVPRKPGELHAPRSAFVRT